MTDWVLHPTGPPASAVRLALAIVPVGGGSLSNRYLSSINGQTTE